MADERQLEHWLDVEGSFKYKEAVKLSTENSKDDPETEPFKSKYAAREILLDIKKKLDSFRADCVDTNDIGTKMKALESVIEYDLALNYIDTEEKGTGERYLNALVDKLEDLRLETEFCCMVMKCYQQLGILWNGRNDSEKSIRYFNEAEKLHNDYKKNVDLPPFESQEHFTTVTEENDHTEKRQSNFENLHTHTLYYITQVYKNIGENKKASEYCHNTLRRQLVTNLYEPADWAVNCATLSQYHLTQENYNYAKHCLACASCVIAECPSAEEREPVNLDAEGEDERRNREHIPQAKANVSLCWSKYCLYLLRKSSERIGGENMEDIDNNSNTAGNEEEMLRFDSLDVSQLESEISDKMAVNYEEARVLFVVGQKRLNEAKEFYKLDGHVTHHVEIVQDHSQLFKYLAFFGSDLERECRMCKRRVDMLTAVLTELNPQHYLLICRQLIYEIASVYKDMADLKNSIIQRDNMLTPTAHQVKKINSLLEQSAKFYASFIDTMKQEGKLPGKYDESVLRITLVVHICLARTYSKRICPAREQKVKNLKRSLELYQYVVDYCDGDEEGAVKLKEELEACREMVELLPFRIERLNQGQE